MHVEINAYLEVLRLTLDSALCMLIWLVQIVIYPSFLYVDKQKIKDWHTRYTRKITYFIAPLLFLQTGVIAYQIVLTDLTYIIDGVFLGIIWINTFFIAVPIHNQVDQAANPEDLFSKLIRVNWWRTLAWSVLFLLSVGRSLVYCLQYN